MDYSSMKKEELIKLLEDQRHLAQAVEVKDKEIFDLKSKIENKENHLKDEIRRLQEEVNIWQKRGTEAERKNVNSSELVEKNAELVDFGNKYIKMHTNMLQSIQGIIELSSDLEKTLIEKIQKSQKE